MAERVCAFVGHRDCDTALRDRTKAEIKDIIENSGISTFYSGGMGDFDSMCEDAVLTLKRTYKIKLCLVVPYFMQRLNTHKEYYTERYDEIIIPELNNTHYKQAITKRNQWMIEQSDIILCHVIRTRGGAYSTLRYAVKINKPMRRLE